MAGVSMVSMVSMVGDEVSGDESRSHYGGPGAASADDDDGGNGGSGGSEAGLSSPTTRVTTRAVGLTTALKKSRAEISRLRSVLDR